MINFEMVNESDMISFSNEMRERTQRQMLVFYINNIERLLSHPIVEGITLKPPMGLFTTNSPDMNSLMNSREEFHIQFKYKPLELEPLYQELEQSWPPLKTSPVFSTQSKRSLLDEYVMGQAISQPQQIDKIAALDLRLKPYVRREVMLGQINSLIKPFSWFKSIDRYNPHRTLIEDIKNIWSTCAPKLIDTMTIIILQESRLDREFTVAQKTLEFCKNHTLITSSNFEAYRRLCFEPIQTQYEEHLIESERKLIQGKTTPHIDQSNQSGTTISAKFKL